MFAVASKGRAAGARLELGVVTGVGAGGMRFCLDVKLYRTGRVTRIKMLARGGLESYGIAN
jgi:hypothetical protein